MLPSIPCVLPVPASRPCTAPMLTGSGFWIPSVCSTPDRTRQVGDVRQRVIHRHHLFELLLQELQLLQPLLHLLEQLHQARIVDHRQVCPGWRDQRQHTYASQEERFIRPRPPAHA